MSEPVASAAGDLLVPMRAVPGAIHRAYVVPKWRVLFNSLNKNACTSLKWMIADLAGEDLDAFTPGLMPFTGQDEAVHNRRLWKASPRLSELDPRLRAEIHPDNGWFVFAVVRDPRTRMFSAWQNKLLIDNPALLPARDMDWYPRHPATADSVVEDFARFVDLIEREPGHGLRRDAHFRDQAELLIPHALDYTRIYDIGEIDALRADLTAHLDSLGWSGELYLPRSNSMPLRANARAFGNGVREQVERIYAADFAMFADRWDYAPIAAANAWSPADLAQVELLAGFGRRIGDLVAMAQEQRSQAREHRAEARRQSARADRAQLQLDRLQRWPSVRTARWLKRMAAAATSRWARRPRPGR